MESVKSVVGDTDQHSEEIKGCRSSSYREEEEGWGGPCQEETINARVSVGAVRTLEHQPLVTAVPLRISEDCSHVRDRCTERVRSAVCV